MELDWLHIVLLWRRNSQLDIPMMHAYAGKVGDACNLATYGQNIKSVQKRIENGPPHIHESGRRRYGRDVYG